MLLCCFHEFINKKMIKSYIFFINTFTVGNQLGDNFDT